MKEYFCGWYFKCQSEHDTLAVIAALHKSKAGKSCSIQLITNDGVWNVPFSRSSLKYLRSGHSSLSAAVGSNLFCNKGVKLHLHQDGLSADGAIYFGPFTPIRYDIMGPFRYIPFMECRHSVFSMCHTVNGHITVNGTDYFFQNGKGYMEGDRGHSFPREYAWTQCFFDGGSLMLSMADIPLGRFHFTGIIGIIRLHGREYRIATYLGARAVKINNGELIVRQGNKQFTATLLETASRPLYAPVNGAMTRTIRESPACRAAYRFTQNGRTLLSFESSAASFEYEYSNTR